jgi:acyl-CoA thioesterase-1
MLGAALGVSFTLLIVSCGGSGKPNTPSAPPSVKTIEAAAKPVDTRPVVAAFGDSISAGFGVEPGKSYPDDLQRLIDQAGFPFQVANLGVSGDTTADGVERLQSVIAVHPEIVILEFGGNDGLRGQPVTESAKNMRNMAGALKAAGAEVVIAGMTLPRNYGPEYIAAFDKMFVDVAKEFGLVRIPFLLDGVGGIPTLMQPDGIHPNATGAEIVARTAMKYLSPVLAKHSRPAQAR